MGIRRHALAAIAAALAAVAFAAVAEFGIRRSLPMEPVVVCTPTAVVLAVDRSGSMGPGSGEDMMPLVQDAVARFVARARADVCVGHLLVGLVTFARDATVDLAPTGDLERLEAAMRQVEPEGGTIIENGIDAATGTLGAAVNGAWRKLLFILTDAENYSSDAASLEASLRASLAADVEVRAVVTEEGPHIDSFRDVIGAHNVLSVDEAAIGETFFVEAEDTVFRASVIAPERHHLATSVWTGLVTAGIVLALLLVRNRGDRRRRLFGWRDAAVVVAGLALGAGVGALAQILPGVGFLAELWRDQEDATLRRWGDLVIWTFIGLLLMAGLAAFRILPNRRLLHAVGFGLLGGLVAGAAYVVLVGVPVDGPAMLPRLMAAAALGLAIGLAFSLFSVVSTQFPLWLKVHYTSDRVDRYHPIGSTPLAVGGGENADVYVQSEQDVVWRFWVERGEIVVDNVVAGKRRTLPFAEVSSRGSIQLPGMRIRIVDDLGPEKGRLP
jgi:hypothetical protein